MEALSGRELEVADLIHRGKIEKEIAEELFISPETVHTHAKNIRRKLGARNSADITRIFLTRIRPYAWLIVAACIAYVIISRVNPALIDTLRTSLISFFK